MRVFKKIFKPGWALLSMNKKPNRLIHETSAYLLQHAYNPVNWFPWGEEAFEKARRENKPIFLSIGYSSCHWCHVMEEESFENNDVAAYLNEHFLSIKVDREERPDIDNAYMQFAVMITGQGGWPLSVFLTSDGEPFFSGTYFPASAKYGMPAFIDALKIVKERYYKNKKEILSFVGEMKKAFSLQQPDKKTPINENAVKKFYDAFCMNFDSNNGGVMGVPKFPPSLSLLFLMKQSKHLENVFLTLKKMGDGGIYDHLAGGFFRYSVDEGWRIPHFEKMLYDNALLLKLYSWAFALSKNDSFKEKADGVFQYAKNVLYSGKGFYPSQDADSNGGEGKYYVFAKEEIRNIAGDAFIRYYCVEEHGEFEGKNVLRVNENINLGNVEKINVEEQKKRLLEYRNKRVHPAIDKKIIVSWNALMVSGLVAYGRYCGNEEALQIAEEVCRNILNECWNGKRLLRIFGKKNLNGFLEDYSFLINALLDLYETCFDKSLLEKAGLLADTAIELFYHGMFFDSSEEHDKMYVKTYNARDNVIPSGCSEMIDALFRLSMISQNKKYNEIIENELGLNMHNMNDSPLSFPVLMGVLSGLHGDYYSVEINGGKEFVADVHRELLKIPVFNIQVFHGNSGENKILVCFRNACNEYKSKEELRNILLEKRNA